MSQGDNGSIRSRDIDYPGGWWSSPRDLSRSCSSLVLYAVSSISKGWVYSLGLCYNLIQTFSIKALRGNKVILRRTSAILQALSSRQILLLFEVRRGCFLLSREREPLARLQIKKILNIPNLHAHLPKCPIPRCFEPALWGLWSSKEVDWGSAFSLLWSSVNLIMKSCACFSVWPHLWL